MTAQETPRPSRSGPPRRPGPDRRDAEKIWELWNLQALWPAADDATLAQLKERRAPILAREREALASLWSGDRVILAPGRRFLQHNPELRTGVIVSLHQGPYQLLAEPFLHQGDHPVVLVNELARKKLAPPSDEMSRRLGHRHRIQWVSVEDSGFVRELIKAVRSKRPVITYIDGNGGVGGYGGTRERGVLYGLPGREIKVRAGLARLICRLECPVHPVAIHWDKDHDPVWAREPSQQWTRDQDPDTVTRMLFDWCFQEVMARPEQWHFWEMLKECSVCFSPSGIWNSVIPVGLRDDFRKAFEACMNKSPDTVRLILERDVQVWPGDVLADLTDDRFFPAEGLQDHDLMPLRSTQPTLAKLAELHGAAWVGFHGLRLCLLGLARLGG